MIQPLKPMLAKASSLPADQENYSFEIKWDGIRAIAYLEKNQLKLFSRNLLDITAQYPELQQLALKHPKKSLILDGEIVAFNRAGHPSFELLQKRMNLSSPEAIRQISQTLPVTYIIFDLLSCDDNLLLEKKYVQRRTELEKLQLSGPYWQTPAYRPGAGAAMLAATKNLGLEGIVAKRLDSAYLPGKRSGDWLKIRHINQQELVIGGWMPGQGKRTGTIGALLTGYYDNSAGNTGQLNYAGKVGSGFSQENLAKLSKTFQSLQRPDSPFSGATPPGAIFIEPSLVGQFEFTEWTGNNTLRHPVFKGLRTDKDPHTVVREPKTT